jgi:hypothetical protein
MRVVDLEALDALQCDVGDRRLLPQKRHERPEIAQIRALFTSGEASADERALLAEDAKQLVAALETLTRALT